MTYISWKQLLAIAALHGVELAHIDWRESHWVAHPCVAWHHIRRVGSWRKHAWIRSHPLVRDPTIHRMHILLFRGKYLPHVVLHHFRNVIDVVIGVSEVLVLVHLIHAFDCSFN